MFFVAGLRSALNGIKKEGEGSGAQSRSRTSDTMLFRHLLYQLSYLGMRYIITLWVYNPKRLLMSTSF